MANPDPLDDAKKIVSTLVSIAFVAFVVTQLVFYIWFGIIQRSSISADPSDWGTYGDFVAGVANPFISFATLFIVALAYISQRKELTATTAALAASAVEQKVISEASTLQAQIQAQTALLNLKVSLRTSAHGDLRQARIASGNDRWSPSTAQAANESTAIIKMLDEDIAHREAELTELLSRLNDLRPAELNNIT